MKVGELAKQTGISVRTLHHYEALGLLVPARQPESGHRHYTGADIARLQQIVALRQLGFSLAEIRGCLEKPELSALAVVRLHRERLDTEIALRQRLRERLGVLEAHLEAAGSPDVDVLLEVIAMTNQFEKYYSSEQLQQLAARAEQLGPERIQAVQEEWSTLIAQVQAAMAQGSDPASPEVQALAARWRALVAEFTGGDAGIARSLGNFYAQEGPEVASRGMFDAAVAEFIGRAMAVQ